MNAISSRWLISHLVAALLASGLGGCGQAGSSADPAPFRQAIAEYLRQGNMAMAIKEIKKGPTIDGSTAQLTASMTHEQLGGPAVVWTFHFQQTGGRWTVVRRE